jgi:hypothetical protein
MKSSTSVAQCGCYVIVLIFNLIVGTFCANYLIDVFFHTTVSTIAAMAIGLVAAEVIVPVTIVVWILKSVGVF